MNQRLTKCVRCSRVFMRIASRVCPACQEDEDRDFDRIREVLDRRPGITPDELVKEAGVSLDCVMRLLEEGRLQAENFGPPPKCGRCSAPAISHSLRLCPKCHAKLNQDCNEAIRDIRQQLNTRRPPQSVHRTHDAFEAKREAYVDRITRLMGPKVIRPRGKG